MAKPRTYLMLLVCFLGQTACPPPDVCPAGGGDRLGFCGVDPRGGSVALGSNIQVTVKNAHDTEREPVQSAVSDLPEIIEVVAVGDFIELAAHALGDATISVTTREGVTDSMKLHVRVATSLRITLEAFDDQYATTNLEAFAPAGIALFPDGRIDFQISLLDDDRLVLPGRLPALPIPASLFDVEELSGPGRYHLQPARTATAGETVLRVLDTALPLAVAESGSAVRLGVFHSTDSRYYFDGDRIAASYDTCFWVVGFDAQGRVLAGNDGSTASADLIGGHDAELFHDDPSNPLFCSQDLATAPSRYRLTRYGKAIEIQLVIEPSLRQ